MEILRFSVGATRSFQRTLGPWVLLVSTCLPNEYIGKVGKDSFGKMLLYVELCYVCCTERERERQRERERDRDREKKKTSLGLGVSKVLDVPRVCRPRRVSRLSRGAFKRGAAPAGPAF